MQLAHATCDGRASPFSGSGAKVYLADLYIGTDRPYKVATAVSAESVAVIKAWLDFSYR